MSNSKTHRSAGPDVLTFDQLELAAGGLNIHDLNLVTHLSSVPLPIPPVGPVGPILPIGPGPVESIGLLVGPVNG